MIHVERDIADLFGLCRTRTEFIQHGSKDFRIKSKPERPCINTRHKGKRYEEHIVTHAGKRYRYHRDVTPDPVPIPLGTLADSLNGKRIR